jgi:hypothetical protein
MPASGSSGESEEVMGSPGARFGLALMCVAVLVSSASARATTDEVFVPTTLHYPGSVVTSARGINNAGDIAGIFTCGAAGCVNPLTNEFSGPGVHGFLLRGGIYTRADVPGSTSTTVRGVSVHGVVVGHYNDTAGVTHGFLYFEGDHVYPIDVPAELFDNHSEPLRHTLIVRMSPNGDLVGCIHEQNLTMTTMHGWLLRNGEFSILSDPDTMHNGVSAPGEAVGIYFSDGISYVVDRSGSVSTFTVDGRFTLAWDVNARGDIVGVVGENLAITVGGPVNPRGFLRSRNGGFRTLAVSGARATQVFGINDRGDVVGQYTDATGTHGFVYRPAR